VTTSTMLARQVIAALCAFSCSVSQAFAQGPAQFVDRPHAPVLWRPYIGATVAPVHLTNTTRLHELIRGGKLYLTVQDTIAVVIENNLDLEVARYGPVTAQWNLERLRAGGALPGVTGGNTLANQVTSGQGVAGSQVSAGLASSGSSGGGSGTNALVSQVGPITPNLDPVFQNGTAFSHRTAPQSNTTQSQTTALVDTQHTFNNLLQEGLLSGGTVQIVADESYLKENAPTNILNPSVAPLAQVLIRHNFLQGFGTGVNSRFIRVATKQVDASHETFRSQLINLVAGVLNLYWDLVTDNEDLKVRRRTLEASNKFLSDTKTQIGLGVVAKVELFRAEADVSARKQELDISEATVRQQELLLKNALSRNGLEDPLVDAAAIVPLDRIEVPGKDDLPGLRDLVARAMANRPDIVLNKINDESAAISALGTANGVLPFLQGLVSTTNHGLSGTPVPQAGGATADAYYAGGLGNALEQIFRRNFYDRRAQIQFQARIGNRVSQADYGIEQLQLRQSDLLERRNLNDMVVSISNQMTAVRQARSRYSQAVDTRALQEQLLQKEQEMFSFGTATITDVVNSRRTFLAAQLAEVQAQASYSRSRVALDQTLGETLEVNHVSLGEAQTGKVVRESTVPATTPQN
jgi:outer membrane protein